MKLMIDISESDYNRIADIPDAFDSLTSRAYTAIRNSIPVENVAVDIKSAIKDWSFEKNISNSDTFTGIETASFIKTDNAMTIIDVYLSGKE